MVQRGWLTVGIDTQAPWCAGEVEWLYDERHMRLRPPGRTAEWNTLPDISVSFIDDADMYRGFGLVRRFMSSLAWQHRTGVEERCHHVSSGMMRLEGSMRYAPHIGGPGYNWPTWSPQDPRQRLAQSLYREAMTVNSLPYRFLGLFKVLEVAAPTAAGRKRLIREATARLDGAARHASIAQGALARRNQLLAMGEKPEDWLYKTCRCAIAHAAVRPVLDPDAVDDTRRLEGDSQLMQAIAESVMVHDLGLISQATQAKKVEDHGWAGA